MKTSDVLTADSKAVVYQLKKMEVKELERHAKKILVSQGQSDFKAVMAVVIKSIPTLSGDDNRFSTMKTIIKDHIPSQVEPPDELIERLTVIFTVLVAKKFKDILAAKK